MFSIFRKYADWLHLQWPAGRVESFPELEEDGTTAVPNFYVVGDLTGIPLIKFAADSGAKVIEKIASQKSTSADADDVIIIGAGVSGVSAGLEAKKRGLRFTLIDANGPFSTISDFPTGKPIFLNPEGMKPAGSLQFSDLSNVKEGLQKELDKQYRDGQLSILLKNVDHVERKGDFLSVVFTDGGSREAKSVVAALGRTGSYRRLGVPGETLPKVFHRLHDPATFSDKNVVVVGGGESAVESGILLAKAKAHVTLVHAGSSFSRVKERMLRDLQSFHIDTQLETEVTKIDSQSITIRKASGETKTLDNDIVFTMIGREPPLDFFRKSGISARGDWTLRTWLGLSLFLLFCVFLFHWKTSDLLFPFDMARSISERGTLLQTISQSAEHPNFYYGLVYSIVVVWFGIRRIQKRKSPYVFWQTMTLIAIQLFPLFILPEILLPWAGNNGWFEIGTLGGKIADLFFEPFDSVGHIRAYWRAYGLILAWPLFIWNVFTLKPMWAWLVVAIAQTFVLIPWLVWRYGKGAYCGWICSCGALAETLGDQHRRKMLHGPFWNKLNFLGQAILAVAFGLFILRVAGWFFPESRATEIFYYLLQKIPVVHYTWFVDLFLSGILGVGLYFWFSGRTWCRFACPLAALMNIYGRFSRFRIFAQKEKCISCNECTAICHQGVDVMGFANKGLPMSDPQCVRCSACIQICPTDVLRFGQLDPKTRLPRYDSLSARQPN